MSAESIKPREDGKDGDHYTFGGKTLTRSEYLGESHLGPMGDHFIQCPKCSTSIHKFSIRCHGCGLVIREIGKIESGPRGSAAKGIGFVVSILVFFLAALVLAERGYSGGTSLPAVIALALAGVLLGVNGLLGVLYFRYFILVTFLKGMSGFGLGAVSLLLGVGCLLLLLL